jgi:hypothetical protein
VSNRSSVLRLKAFTILPLTRFDAEDMSHKIDLLQVETIDCTDVPSTSHCFADELFMRIGHDAEIINASDFVQRIMQAGRTTASRDWET